MNKTDAAYIAGFLDGDGSLMLQFKKRKDSKRLRVMVTICLYQDTRHAQPLEWMKQQLQIGYLSLRNDGITELRINGFDQVRTILLRLKPYIRFKAVQVELLLEAISILQKKLLIKEDWLCIIDIANQMRSHNYASRKSAYIAEELLPNVYLDPVTTEA